VKISVFPCHDKPGKLRDRDLRGICHSGGELEEAFFVVVGYLGAGD
jgi:hypothetical protein